MTTNVVLSFSFCIPTFSLFIKDSCLFNNYDRPHKLLEILKIPLNLKSNKSDLVLTRNLHFLLEKRCRTITFSFFPLMREPIKDTIYNQTQNSKQKF